MQRDEVTHFNSSFQPRCLTLNPWETNLIFTSLPLK